MPTTLPSVVASVEQARLFLFGLQVVEYVVAGVRDVIVPLPPQNRVQVLASPSSHRVVAHAIKVDVLHATWAHRHQAPQYAHFRTQAPVPHDIMTQTTQVNAVLTEPVVANVPLIDPLSGSLYLPSNKKL